VADDLAAQLHDAAELSAMGRDRSALSLLRRLAAEHPRDPAVQCHLALALLRSGSCKPALAAADNAVALGGDEAQAQHLRGAALLRTGQAALAVDALRRAQAAAPGDAGVLCELAIAQCAGGDVAGGLASAEAAVRLQPRGAAAHNAAAVCLLALRRWPEAEAAARRALEVNRGDVQASNNLALALASQGNRLEALTFLREARTHSEVMRSAHDVVVRNQRLLGGGDDSRGALRTAALSGQMYVLVFLMMFVVVAFFRNPWSLAVLLVALALVLRTVLFRGFGGTGPGGAPQLTALPATARVGVPRPERR